MQRGVHRLFVVELDVGQRRRRLGPFADGIGSRGRDLFVALRIGGSTDTYSPNHFTLVDDGHAALQGREVHCDHRGSAVFDDVFKDFGRLLELNGSPGLADGNVGAGIERFRPGAATPSGFLRHRQRQ